MKIITYEGVRGVECINKETTPVKQRCDDGVLGDVPSTKIGSGVFLMSSSPRTSISSPPKCSSYSVCGSVIMTIALPFMSLGWIEMSPPGTTSSFNQRQVYFNRLEKKSWRNLGQQSRIDSMASFVFLMDRVCPPFKKFISDHIESTPENSELHKLDLSARSEQPVNWEVFEAQKKQIQDALNAQTFHQFSAYAQQQFPGQPEQQSALIRQLQEQHYQQYMSQVYAQQAEAAVPESERRVAASTAERLDEERARDDDSDVSDEEPGDDLPSNPEIAPASLWNRKDIVEFKNAIKKEGSEGIIKVGYGETVTVRVPTHEDGTCLFWEFATDYYDIGFGVYFEWTIADSNQVSIHVSESDDEEEYDEAAAAAGVEGGSLPAQGTNPAVGDVESGGPTRAFRDPNKPRQDEIIPVYRRDCHEEVYAGSHSYPGRGVYLLKFDNSYSLWRSKTLYYRVYYSK
ncbi:hypothetical protein KIN20_016239 [Parelaphostrongylus tenuis]|uniref:GOLD domain-containing protein n=1 Tax=Parelaphostrongylus tenuis TaxID=148309 RepID=A0AAD5N520_PARTN|nr:hypothetical protein KIN20_016239 [Parelaphostrongylus tenuis]